MAQNSFSIENALKNFGKWFFTTCRNPVAGCAVFSSRQR